MSRRPLNDDPFQPWNGFDRDDPFAAHNGFDADNPFKLWNSPFGKAEDLNDEERRSYNLPSKRRNEEEDYYPY